jgi:hypothetical protein
MIVHKFLQMAIGIVMIWNFGTALSMFRAQQPRRAALHALWTMVMLGLFVGMLKLEPLAQKRVKDAAATKPGKGSTDSPTVDSAASADFR